MPLPGATIDGPLTARPIPSQRTATVFDVRWTPVEGSDGVGSTTYATKVCSPVFPVTATLHSFDCVHAPTSAFVVESKTSIAHGVPVTLVSVDASSNVV